MKLNAQNPYSELAEIYDSLFFALGKDYYFESQKIQGYIETYKKSSGNQLLDLGCGTGEHIRHLKHNYHVIGIDNSKEMLASAEQKNPDVNFKNIDMVHFQVDQKFDAIICLFSAIGYVRTKEKLEQTVKNVSFHLKNGGIFIVEPWYSPDEIQKHLDLVEFGEKQGIKACRMRETKIVGNIAKSYGHILVSQNGHVKHLLSHHIFGLFSKSDFIEAFEKNGLIICSTECDLSGRGLYIGMKRL